MSFTFGGPSSPFKPKYMRGTPPAPAAPPTQPGLPTLKPQQLYLQNQLNKPAPAATKQTYTPPPLPMGTDPAPKQAIPYTPPPLPMGTEPAFNPQAAAAASAGRAAASASNAASTAGLNQQSAQGATMATAANAAAAPAAAQTAPAQDFNLTKQPWITESGRLYERQVEDRLKGNDPLVKNAQATADTQASRNNYYARTSAQENAAQARFAPGTIQYQRMTDESQAGANRANLTGQNNVNQFTRERSADAMGLAKGLESTAYGYANDDRNFKVGERNYADGRGDVMYQRERNAKQDAINEEDKTYTRNITERTYQDTQKLLASGDIKGMISAMPTQKGKNYLTQVLASGGDVKAKLAEMFNPDNSLKTEFRDDSPVADIRSQAEEWINLTMPGADPATKESAILQRMQDLDATKQGPVDDAKKARELQAIEAKISTGGTLKPEEVTAAIEGGLISNVTDFKTKADISAKVGQLVTFGDGTTGKILESKDNRGEALMVLDIGGKRVEYMPGRAQFHIYSGGKDRWFTSKDEAMAFLNGGK